ncbi:MAG: selenide, water dikinase SelD [Bacteroidales bacterium]
MEKKVDLLSLVEQGGCSAKLNAKGLDELLKEFHLPADDRVLVDISTHDDAGVIRISQDEALILTTDFFPPVCSDPYTFGKIAAANALSDVFAMGGEVVGALNILLFPAFLPLDALREILRGGQEKVTEAGGIILGGHTIEDEIPKYGLAVTGRIHPEQLTTNSGVVPGDKLILTKPVGTGVIVAAKKAGIVSEKAYSAALESMMELNRNAAEAMRRFGIRAATDITGFGIAGHALKMARASGVTLRLKLDAIPLLPDVPGLISEGCIPGAAFRNKEYSGEGCHFGDSVSYDDKIILFDAQTSGGILMAVPGDKAGEMLTYLHENGVPDASLIGEAIGQEDHFLVVE